MAKHSDFGHPSANRPIGGQSYQTLLLEKDGNVARITLNRPKRLNAVDWNMYIELSMALEECEYDDEARVVVITGTGRAFCAGEDMKSFFNEPILGKIPWEGRGDLRHMNEGLFRCLKALLAHPKPVVAMVNGIAFGAGFYICLASDFRIISEKAVFSIPLVLSGMCPPTVLLERYVGLTEATELLLLGKQIDAKEAQRLGLANQVVKPELLEDAVETLTGELAKGATNAMRFIKRALHQEMSARFEFEAANCMFGAAVVEDIMEGARAFQEGREPEFKGK